MSSRDLYKLTLKRIEDNFEQAEQWSDQRKGSEWSYRSLVYIAKCEALLELLEEFNCGSVGGFDEGQEPPRTIVRRLEWVKRKLPEKEKQK